MFGQNQTLHTMLDVDEAAQQAIFELARRVRELEARVAELERTK